jgi:hypothetical protein
VDDLPPQSRVTAGVGVRPLVERERMTWFFDGRGRGLKRRARQGARMSGRDWVLRIVIPATLLVYVTPVLLMACEGVGMWWADAQGQIFKAGPFTSLFVLLIAQPNGPLGMLQKAMAVLSSAALVSTLWSPKDRILDVLLVGMLAAGLIAALVAWSVLLYPHIVQEAWQSTQVPGVSGAEAFAAIRDPYFSNLITTLATFGAVLTGIKLKGG